MVGVDEKYDYSKSVYEDPKVASKRRRNPVPLSALGLTNNLNVVSAAGGLNSRLDDHVMYSAFAPHVDPQHIETCIAEANDPPSINVDDTDDDEYIVPPNDPDPEELSAMIIGRVALKEPSAHMKSRIKLLKLMRDKGIPLGAFEEICKWAWDTHHTTGAEWDRSSRSCLQSRESLLNELKKDNPDLFGVGFQSKLIKDWNPQKVKVKRIKKNTPAVQARPPPPPITVQQVHVRSFDEALKGLLTDPLIMKEENLSFPNKNSPLSWDNDPKISGRTKICELHHGSWWKDTWKRLCSENTDEILVPLIFYMDGTTIDKGRKMSLCPLQMTLGIFNVKTRRHARAWQTLYFSPKTTNCENGHKGIANLHLGLEEALRSVREACSGRRDYEWSNLPWNGREWKVKMKFAVAYVIGDTEMHDRFCGRVPTRTNNSRMLCRHCDCPYDDTNSPRCNMAEPGNPQPRKLWKPQHFTNPMNEDFLKDVNHYSLSNAFHPLEFGVNQHNIHLATPGEKLHMHQLGVAKRFVETFNEFTGSTVTDSATKTELTGLAEEYGKALSRQSDRDFPRMRFTKHLDSANKEGKHFSGILITIILALVSVDGQKSLGMGASVQRKKAGYRAQIEAAELILGMEEFLGSLDSTKNDYRNFPRMIVHFVNVLNRHCARSDGAGNKLIKIHLYFHLPKYIEMWGPPDGWDSSYCESNHKSEIKAPAQKTQMNTSTLIEQTANRHMEYRLIDRLSDHVKDYDVDASTSSTKPTPPLSEAKGSKFTISVNDDDQAIMTWASPAMRKNHQVHNKDILDFCLKVIQRAVDGDTVKGFTENIRYDPTRQKRFIFRAHPSYRDEGLQRDGVWYDWAKFVYNPPPNPQYFGGQILCFLDLRNNILDTADAKDLVSNGPGLYAVVRQFRTFGVDDVDGSSFIKQVSLSEQLVLHHCDTIHAELAVVENFGSKQRGYFVVHNRTSWLSKFKQKMDGLKSKTFDAIIHEGDEGQ